jgi:MoxR-like ATPase
MLDEIFGPLSLRALENDQYVRCIDGFLPTATVAFLDEIFKANSAILNTLLTILNERQFDNGAGSKRFDCPLKCVIGASNELPESDELDALLDRFLLRAQVSPVSDDGLLKILSSSQLSKEDELVNSERNYSDGLDEVFRNVSESLPSITMNQNVCILIKDIRNFVTDTLGQYVSDRRLVKAARLLRVSAATHGRKQVDLVDVLLLQHMLWTYPQQKDALREFIIDNLTPNNDIVDQSKFLLQGLASEALTMVKKTMGDVTGKSGAREADLDAIKSIITEAGEIKRLLEQHSNDLERHIALLSDLEYNNIWITPDEAQSVKQNCLPLAVAASNSIAKVLNDAAMLTLALEPGVIDDDLRSSVIDALMESSEDVNTMFTDDELELSLKEAKRLFKGDQLKQWKKARNSIGLT